MEPECEKFPFWAFEILIRVGVTGEGAGLRDRHKKTGPKAGSHIYCVDKLGQGPEL